jgi:transcriptional regulator with XRE-family HTH domain
MSVLEADGDRDLARRTALASFVSSRRARLHPEDVGIVPHGRRRVAGLRRHEVADLAYISVTWYTWLEQGRSIRLSEESVDSLARALKLSEDEWRHMRRLAGVPVTSPREAPPNVEEELRGLLDDLLPNPALITNELFDVLAWNQAHARLSVDPAGFPPQRRNLLWILFMAAPLRDLMPAWATEAQGVVARFRAEAGKYPGDPRFEALIYELTDASEDFRRLWAQQEVRRFVPGIQIYDHPEVGRVRAREFQLRPVDQPGLVVLLHRAADDLSEARLRQLTAS